MRRRDYVRELRTKGEHLASLLERSKWQSDTRPTDDSINAAVNAWRNAYRDSESAQ